MFAIPTAERRNAAGGTHESPPGKRRPWMFWRSPERQPWWARPALLAVAALAAILYGWNVSSSGFTLYYSNAVKSMSVSWKALLFGALDPAATITTDKIPGAFVPQALSVKLFGFHAWAVALPQCVAGVVSVLVMYRVVRRWVGPLTGLCAAALFAFTPVLASMFGHSMEDGALTLCLVLAADCFQRALLDARLRSLVFAGIWIGLGFQAKMLQSWLVLPALAVGYLVAAPVELRRRVAHTAVAGAICLAVSLSWVLMMTVVPAKHRPYVDGSTNNSAFAMVFGYNGLERFGIDVPGSAPSFGSRPPGAAPAGGPGGAAPAPPAPPAPPAAPAAPPAASAAPAPPAAPAGAPRPGTGPAPAPGAPGTAGGPGAPGAPGAPAAPPAAGAPGAPGAGKPGAPPAPPAPPGPPGADSATSPWLKLFTKPLAPQIGWLYPFAVLGLALGLWWRRRAPRTDRLRGGLLLWGTWLVTVGLVFSKMDDIPHTAYMATLAPPLAALAACGITLMWRAYRKGGPRAWALPAAVAAEAAWSWHLASNHSGFLPWLRWLVAAVCALGVVTMAVARLGDRTRTRLLLCGAAIGLAGAVAAPVAWSASVLDRRYGGSAFDATAGPSEILAEAEMLQERLASLPAPPPAGPPPADGTTPPGGPKPPGGPATPGGPPAPGGSSARDGSPDRDLPPGGTLLNATATLTSSEKKLYAYVKAHQEGADYPLVTDGWRTPFILATGDRVLPLGGFSGSAPQPTLRGFRGLVQDGDVRFVLLSGPDTVKIAGMGGRPEIRDWVKGHCAAVPPASYGVDAAEERATAGLFGPSRLYRCGAS
ncbi:MULTISPECIES: ArnT family glycosyltransferase [Streptomyces]|uniref:ArnT family glycosyltransferase n=1 Tax=Streptomyces TaxID=1883 RepID=UPI001CCE4A6C|nr:MULTISPECIES: glycosyltransferase family 39 protein [Streptomyces]UBI36115.1 glycosyltransferase family 39 protein [Streptomyces mobaraensis]UKW28710.1 glycosyltransferase family 39 protein [Streptomyces sp. TYQ1024]